MRRPGILDRLCQQSLVECDAGLYSLHDLLREVALEEPPADEVYYRHAAHYLERANVADELYDRGQTAVGLLAFDAALAHLRGAHAWVRQRRDLEALQWLNTYGTTTVRLLHLDAAPPERCPSFEGCA